MENLWAKGVAHSRWSWAMGRSIAGSVRRHETLNQFSLLYLFQFKLVLWGIGKGGVASWGMRGRGMPAGRQTKAHSHARHLRPSPCTSSHHDQQPLLHLLASTGSRYWQVVELSYLSQGPHKAQEPTQEKLQLSRLGGWSGSAFFKL